MSMNLHCNMIELNQTPTYITYMCMMDDTGTIGYKYTGKKALAALLRYKEWYENRLIERFEYEQESGVGEEELKETQKHHETLRKEFTMKIKDIEKNGLSKLEVWYT